ncbi:O-methyltransferase [Catalinimonas niigatensis]|uniref:O-methyltransferase n=1 Tax=Catalinimonas niigatensis TaxID=1397264 RepID=UPI00266703C6|nr:class I SAM-dependent methyltransferase [Catalinimonas niigatensis]WPP50258.1 class I SAM-dependent methyltransferase [Catalinimonas niigatensis]
MGKFSLIKGYLHYWLHAVNKHSLHAPFVYDFYSHIVNKDHHELIFSQIEAHRQAYLHDHTFITTNSPGATSQLTGKKKRKISSIARHSLSSPKFSRFLYRLTRWKKPNVIIELGSSLGINTLYLSFAHPEAKIYTFEGCPQTAAFAKRLYKNWELKNIILVEGNIDQTLHQILDQVSTVDLVYMDANHRYAPTLQYYEILYAKANPDSIIVVDDIYWSAGMQRAWKHLADRSEVNLSLDIFDAGLLFFLPLYKRQHYTLMF